MKKLRILFSLNRFYPEVGGAETNLYFQANTLAKSHDVTIFTPKRTADPTNQQLNNYHVKRFFDLLNPFNKYPNLKVKTLCPGMFFSVLFGKPFDVVMCFPAVSYNNRLVMIAAKIRKIPIVLCFFDLIDYSSVIAEQGTISPSILNTYEVPKKEIPFIRMADHIYAISNREIDVLKKINPNVSYSPVPIMLSEYEDAVANPRVRYGIAEQDFVFLSLGRISAIKGQEIVLNSFIEVAKRHSQAKLVFVGRDDFEPEIANRMKQTIARAGLESNVLFTGVLERHEVLGWLRYSDVHVIPVRFMNSGAVVVESWASNTPVIQSDAVDPNLVQDGINGYLFESENIEQLSKKMDQAIQEREQLQTMAEHGNQLVRARYTYEYLISLYENQFSELEIS